MESFKHGIVARYKAAMKFQNCNTANLSSKTGISMFLLILILQIPFYRIKLTQHTRLCNALSLSINDIPNDIHCVNL